VLTGPLPSMPVAFWNDPDGAKYRAAYFEADPSVWTHGDWISRTPNGGFVVHGRSDATLNRDGVRLGSAEIYAALQELPELRDFVVLGLEIPGGGYWMPLFVQLADGARLDDELVGRIRSTIRTRATARHVPDAVEEVPAIPTTHAGKRIEVPLKKLFLGQPADTAVNRGSLANPESVDWFVDRARVFRAENGMEPS
jgi:acetoacetyl-CoA synthetase